MIIWLLTLTVINIASLVYLDKVGRELVTVEISVTTEQIMNKYYRYIVDRFEKRLIKLEMNE